MTVSYAFPPIIIIIVIAFTHRLYRFLCLGLGFIGHLGHNIYRSVKKWILKMFAVDVCNSQLDFLLSVYWILRFNIAHGCIFPPTVFTYSWRPGEVAPWRPRDWNVKVKSTLDDSKAKAGWRVVTPDWRGSGPKSLEAKRSQLPTGWNIKTTLYILVS